MSIKCINVYAVNIKDVPGSMQSFLIELARENIDLNGMIVVSGGGNKGTAYLSSKVPDSLISYLRRKKIDSTEMAGFLISGKDRIGSAANAIDPLTNAGINGIAGAAMVCENKFGMLIVVKATDGDAAQKVLT
jgi:hypothetical protein